MTYPTDGLKSRISLHDTVREAVMKMGGGNPGGLSVCTDIFIKGAEIDPDDSMPGIGPVLTLDTLRIYEHRIWMLYKDVCGQDLTKMVAVLRGYQLGLISDVEINNAIDPPSPLEFETKGGLDVEDLLKKVKEKLPKFARGKNAHAT